MKTKKRKMTAAKVEALQRQMAELPLHDVPLAEPSDEDQELGKAAPWDDISVNPSHPDWVKLFAVDADTIERIDVRRVKTPKEALPYKPHLIHADEDEVGRRLLASMKAALTDKEKRFLLQYALTPTPHSDKDLKQMSRIRIKIKETIAHHLAQLQHFILLSGAYGGLRANKEAAAKRAAWEKERKERE